MSSFKGRMSEYQEISLDRFDGVNLSSTVYFLSHKHEDHMKGLADSAFAYRLQSNNHIKLYCSEVTKKLLRADNRYRHLEPSLVTLEYGLPMVIGVVDQETGKVSYMVTVTLLHAEHCPGSGMFLFEGREGCVLYTGDFRLTLDELQAMSHLHENHKPKKLRSLYIDTTFCIPRALFIPTRETSTDSLVKLVREWLDQSPNNHIWLNCRARLGYEDVFRVLAREFKTKVHVDADRYHAYSSIDQLSEFTTAEASETRIHACTWKGGGRLKDGGGDSCKNSPLPCGYLPSDAKDGEVAMRRITLSTMWFTLKDRCSECAVRDNRRKEAYRVCYSFHSSYTEIRDLVMYLRPQHVVPNVIPGESLSEVQGHLSRFLQMAVALNSPPNSQTLEKVPLGRLKKNRKAMKRKAQVSTGSDDLILGTPEKSEKKPKLDSKSDDGVQNLFHITDSSQELTSQDTPRKAVMNGVNNEEMMTDDSYSGSGAEDEGVDLTEAALAAEQSDNEVIFDGSQQVPDEVVTKALEEMKPYRDGCFGDHITYVSDEDEEEDGKMIVGDSHNCLESQIKQNLNSCQSTDKANLCEDHKQAHNSNENIQTKDVNCDKAGPGPDSDCDSVMSDKSGAVCYPQSSKTVASNRDDSSSDTKEHLCDSPPLVDLTGAEDQGYSGDTESSDEAGNSNAPPRRKRKKHFASERCRTQDGDMSDDSPALYSDSGTDLSDYDDSDYAVEELNETILISDDEHNSTTEDEGAYRVQNPEAADSGEVIVLDSSDEEDCAQNESVMEIQSSAKDNTECVRNKQGIGELIGCHSDENVNEVLMSITSESGSSDGAASGGDDQNQSCANERDCKASPHSCEKPDVSVERRSGSLSPADHVGNALEESVKVKDKTREANTDALSGEPPPSPHAVASDDKVEECGKLPSDGELQNGEETLPSSGDEQNDCNLKCDTQVSQVTAKVVVGS